MSEDRIPKKVLNIKCRGNCPRGRWISNWSNKKERCYTEGRKSVGRKWELKEGGSRWRGLIVRQTT
jgi:hypothetical protein